MKATLLDVGGVASARWNDKYENRFMAGLFIFLAAIIAVTGFGTWIEGLINTRPDLTYTITQPGKLSLGTIGDNNLILENVYNGEKQSLTVKPDQNIPDENTTARIITIIIDAIIFVAAIIVVSRYNIKETKYIMMFKQKYLDTGEIPDIYP